ncbi:hypothetical protein AB9F39_39390, partial [Rhizobium leguminosarum]
QSIPASFWASHPDIAFSYCPLREWVHSQAMCDVQRAYSEIAAQIVSKGKSRLQGLPDIFQGEYIPHLGRDDFRNDL